VTTKYLLHLSVCWVALYFPPAAMALDVTFGFTGVVTEVDAALATEFSVGEPVVGSYTFESTTADSNPGDPTLGIYDNAISLFTATFGGDYTVTQGFDSGISIADGLPDNDVYQVFLEDPVAPTVAGLNLGALFIGLADTDSVVFASDALPLTPPNLFAFDVESSGMLYLDSPNRAMQFQLTSLTLVPEPTSLTLTAFALLSMGYRRRKQV
jgi:hypothetical protein